MKYLICMSINGKTREVVYYLSKTKDNKYTYELFKRAEFTDNKFSLEEAKLLIPEAKKLMKNNSKYLFNMDKLLNSHHTRKYKKPWNIFLLKETKIKSFLKELNK